MDRPEIFGLRIARHASMRAISSALPTGDLRLKSRFQHAARAIIQFSGVAADRISDDPDLLGKRGVEPPLIDDRKPRSTTKDHPGRRIRTRRQSDAASREPLWCSLTPAASVQVTIPTTATNRFHNMRPLAAMDVHRRVLLSCHHGEPAPLAWKSRIAAVKADGAWWWGRGSTIARPARECSITQHQLDG